MDIKVISFQFILTVIILSFFGISSEAGEIKNNQSKEVKEILNKSIKGNDQKLNRIFNLEDLRDYLNDPDSISPIKTYNKSFLEKFRDSDKKKRHKMNQKIHNVLIALQKDFEKFADTQKININVQNEYLNRFSKITSSFEEKNFNYRVPKETDKKNEKALSEEDIRAKSILEEMGGVGFKEFYSHFSPLLWEYSLLLIIYSLVITVLLFFWIDYSFFRIFISSYMILMLGLFLLHIYTFLSSYWNLLKYQFLG